KNRAIAGDRRLCGRVAGRREILRFKRTSNGACNRGVEASRGAGGHDCRYRSRKVVRHQAVRKTGVVSAVSQIVPYGQFLVRVIAAEQPVEPIVERIALQAE